MQKIKKFLAMFLMGIILIPALPQQASAEDPFVCGDDVVYGGQSYATTQIGNRCWFAENLNIGTLVDSKNDQADASGGSFEKYCNNNDEASCTTDGGMYQWHTAMAFDDTCDKHANSAPCVADSVHQGVCPAGWHLPKKSEFDSLATFLGGAAVAGGKLKQTGTTNWSAPNTGASDYFGFSALGVGVTDKRGRWKSDKDLGAFWVATYSKRNRAYAAKLSSSSSGLAVQATAKEGGASVRCVYDQDVDVVVVTHNLSYEAGAHGSLTGPTVQTLVDGDDAAAVTAVADADYAFEDWSDGSTDNPRTDLAVTRDISVTANFTYIGTPSYTLTYSAGANGILNGSTSQTVDQGSDGTAVTAVANTNYEFSSWSDGSTANPRTDTNVQANKSLVALFTQIPQYTLSYGGGDHGTIDGNSSQTVYRDTDGSEVTAIPDSGYRFTSWSDSSTDNPRTDLAVTSNLSITANYEAIPLYSLSYSTDGNGTISGSAAQLVYLGGNGTPITAVPNTDYQFVQWSDGVLTNSRSDINVTQDVNVTASFEFVGISEYSLVYSAGANGSVSGNLNQTVAEGGNGTAVTAVPDSGYEFSVWSDGSTDNPKTDTNVTISKNLVAYFTAIPQYTLRYNAGTNGSISGTSPQTVYRDADGTAVTAVPDTHYVFAQWSDGVTDNPRTDTNVTASKTVTAEYTAVPSYTLSYSPGTNGTLTGPTSQTIFSGEDGAAVTAVANEDYEFTQWSDGVTSNPRTDTNVTANKSVTAEYTFIGVPEYTLSYTAGSNGYLTGSTTQIIEEGSNGTAVTAVPNSGYEFVNWSDSSTANPRTDTNVTANKSVTANFALITEFNLNYTAGPNGSLTGTTSQTVDRNADGTAVTAVADTDYAFFEWSDGSSANPRTDTNVTSHKDVTANFIYTGIDNNAPTAPGNLSVASVDYESAVINLGSASTDVHFAEYAIYYAAGTSVTEEDFSIDSTSVPDLAFEDYNGRSQVTLTNLVPNTQYTANIWAYDEADNSRSATSDITFTTLSDTTDPTTPGNMKVVFIGQTSVGIKFGSQSDDNFFQDYKIYYDQGTTVSEADTEVNSTTHSSLGSKNYGGEEFIRIDGLTANTQYTANIWAYDYYGNSATAVTPVTFTTQSDNFVKAARTEIAYTIKDPTVVEPVAGYGDDIQSTTRAKFNKNVGYTKTNSVLDAVAVNVPSNTTMTVKNTSDQEVLTDATAMTLSTTTDTTGMAVPSVGELSFGFQTKKVDLSQAVTLTIDTTGIEDGTTLDVYTKSAGGSWGLHGSTCVTFSGQCQFTTTHLSDFSAGKQTYTLTYTAGANGSISGDTPQTVTEDENGTLVTAIADSNFKFSNWSDTSTDNPRIDTNITADLSVTANFVESVPPTVPGNLTVSNLLDETATINYGSASSDANFTEYKVFYKRGTGVTENDTELNSGTLPGLAYANYNGAPGFNFSNLLPYTTYSFNIWAYDAYGNKASAAEELTFKTLVADNDAPSAPGALMPKIIGQDQAWFKLGDASNDTNFSEYKMYYDTGTSGVSEADTEINSTSKSLLGDRTFSGNTMVNLESLSGGTDYVTNIWAYDSYGNKRSSQEVSFQTMPTDSILSTRDALPDSIKNSTIAAHIPGYGSSTQNASRMKFNKETKYTKSTTIDAQQVVQIPSNTTFIAYNTSDQEVAADFSSMTLSNTADTSGFPVYVYGSMSYGFDNKKIVLDNAITLRIADISSSLEGQTIDVYTKSAGDASWSILQLDGEDVTCTVTDRTCEFQTKHLSDFGAGGGGVGGSVPEFSTYMYFLALLSAGWMINKELVKKNLQVL